MLLNACVAPAIIEQSTPTPKLTYPQTTSVSIYTLSVNVSPSGAGFVSPPGGNYESGLQVTLTATPTSGYVFDYWDGAAASSSPTVTITIGSNKSATAHFKAVVAQITTTPTPKPTQTITTTPIPAQTSTPTSTTTPTPTPTPTTSPITSKAELIQFLTTNFSTCQTSLGSTTFTFDVIENNTITDPYDYWILVDYDVQFFYDVQYSNKITTAQANQVCGELKAFQEKLARAVITAAPDKKLYGGYNHSWYTYPTIKVDLNVLRYYSWVNYSPDSILTSYEDAKISGFSWWPLIDDTLAR
jgi:hypothetical protein